MFLEKLQLALKEEPAFRLKQARDLAYRNLISDWSEATSLPPKLRERLNLEAPIRTMEAVRTTASAKNDTIKVAFRLHDGQMIETVLMKHEDGRNTVCVSSQAGCPMACAFCATGTLGLKRNLVAEEIADQALWFARELKKEGQAVTNVVLMGMGEPMHNYDSVMTALRLLNDPRGFNFGARRMSVSTCGIVPGILKMADDPLQANLAISLHAPTDDLRSKLMPVNVPYPIDKLFDAIKTYVRKTSRKVMFEVLLIDGVNDRPEDAEALADLLIRHHPEGLARPIGLYHVNLIKYHTTEVSKSVAERFGLPTHTFPSSPIERRRAYMKILEDRGISVTHRITFGEDIAAACGQLANKGA